jgi:DNA repair ATPase RecN
VIVHVDAVNQTATVELDKEEHLEVQKHSLQDSESSVEEMKQVNRDKELARKLLGMPQPPTEKPSKGSTKKTKK